MHNTRGSHTASLAAKLHEGRNLPIIDATEILCNIIEGSYETINIRDAGPKSHRSQ